MAYSSQKNEKELEDVFGEVASELLYPDDVDIFKLISFHDGAQKIRSELRAQQWNHSENYEGIDFNNAAKCYGYLNRYAKAHYLVTRRSIEDVFSSSSMSKYKEVLLNQNKINVVSVGGGPGNDIMSFCSLLSEMNYFIEQLNLTVVDLKEGWKTSFEKLIKTVRIGDFGKISEMFRTLSTTHKFVQADLNDFPVPVDIREADVVLMTKVLSVIPDSKKIKILQNIFSAMKKSALFIYTDIEASRVHKTGVCEGMSLILYTPKQTMYISGSNNINKSTYEICALVKQ